MQPQVVKTHHDATGEREEQWGSEQSYGHTRSLKALAAIREAMGKTHKYCL